MDDCIDPDVSFETFGVALRTLVESLLLADGFLECFRVSSEVELVAPPVTPLLTPLFYRRFTTAYTAACTTAYTAAYSTVTPPT